MSFFKHPCTSDSSWLLCEAIVAWLLTHCHRKVGWLCWPYTAWLYVLNLPVLFFSLIFLIAPYWHWQQAHLHLLYLHSFPCWDAWWAELMDSMEGLHQSRELTRACSSRILVYLLFSISFSLFHSEIHERSNPLCEERLPRVRDRVGDASPRISAPGLCLCWADGAAFALHPQGQEDNSPQDVLRDTQPDGARPRKQVSGRLPGAGISLSPWMVAVILCTGVGEQEQGSGHTQWPSKGSEHALGRVGGGVWATWGVAQLLGYARGTSMP